MKLLNIIRDFRKNESGASMVEYGVALLVVTTIGVLAVRTLGGTVGGLVTGANTAILGS